MKTIKTNRVLNCKPSVNTDADWIYDDAVSASFTKKPKTLPATVDLRQKWWSINDQGDSGSCVGWASTDGLLRWHLVNKKVLAKDELLSIRFIWMSSKETDEFTTRPSTFIEEAGTSLKAALDIARKYGCVTDKMLPFANASLYGGTERTFYAWASRYKIVNYFNLIGKSENKLDIWKQWLAAGNGPILTRLDIDQAWDEATKNKGELETYLPDTIRGGHAVCLVGYIDDKFIVRNSWGEDWGDKGFAYASSKYAKKAFNEAYGISV
jgi:C1A family cysteine protease